MQGTREDFSYLQSNHEEADTKIVLHAVDATTRGATDLRIYSPDTDVFILALRRYSKPMQEHLVYHRDRGKSSFIQSIEL